MTKIEACHIEHYRKWKYILFEDKSTACEMRLKTIFPMSSIALRLTSKYIWIFCHILKNITDKLRHRYSIVVP